VSFRLSVPGPPSRTILTHGSSGWCRAHHNIRCTVFTEPKATLAYRLSMASGPMPSIVIISKSRTRCATGVQSTCIIEPQLGRIQHVLQLRLIALARLTLHK
jgi:hypothetical protein